MKWIPASIDSDYDGTYLGYIEKLEECKAINHYQRTIYNHMNKWVLQEGETLLYYMELPKAPDKAVEALNTPAKEGMKWVKVSEREPSIGDYYYCKIDLKKDGILQTIVEWGVHKNGSYEYYDWDLKNVQHFGTDIGEEAEVIEWLDESTPAKEVEAISDSEDYNSGVNTFIGQGLTGWQVGFSIGCQTFYLQPNLVEERGTKEWAEWLEKCLKTAFSKMEVHGIKEAAKEAISDSEEEKSYRLVSSKFLGKNDGLYTYEITFNQSLEHTRRFKGIEDGLNNYRENEAESFILYVKMKHHRMYLCAEGRFQSNYKRKIYSCN